MEVAGGGQLVSTKHSGGNISRGLLWSWKAAWDSFHGEELFLGRKIAAPCLSSLLQPRFGHLERRLLVRDWLFHPLNVPLHVNYLLQWEVLIERQTVAAASAKPFFSPNVSASISTLLSLLGPKSVRNFQEGQVFWELACLLVKFSKNELRWPKSAELILKF